MGWSLGGVLIMCSGNSVARICGLALVAHYTEAFMC